MDDAARQAILDAEHLRLLRIGYLIAAGVCTLFALFPLIHVSVGLFLYLTGNAADESRVIGLFFVGIGLTLSLSFAAMATTQFLAARAIASRQRRRLCLVAAALSCLFFPFGTALGIFTFAVLARPTVMAMFPPTAAT